MLRWFGNATADGACLNIRECHAPKERVLPRACAVSDDGGHAMWTPESLPAVVEIVRSVFFVEEFWLPGCGHATEFPSSAARCSQTRVRVQHASHR